jgi:crossover junction endodeoxyribonuclease RuvC
MTHMSQMTHLAIEYRLRAHVTCVKEMRHSKTCVMPCSSVRGDVVTAPAIPGIDPGAHGAIAVLNGSGDLLEVLDMPSTPEANGRSATNAPLLAGILARARDRSFCELVGARPTDAKVAAFAFGRARGVIEGCAGALSLPIVFLTPPTWKRLADIPPGMGNKDLARTRAIARWPAHADLFARKCNVDRAEAVLIALAGLRREAHHNRAPNQAGS